MGTIKNDGKRDISRVDGQSQEPSEFWRSRIGRLGAASGTRPNFSWHTYQNWRNRAREDGNGDDWLDSGESHGSRFLSFEHARAFARRQGLKNASEWRRFARGKLHGMHGKSTLPSDVPADPEAAYRDNGWISYSDWLGHNG